MSQHAFDVDEDYLLEASRLSEQDRTVLLPQIPGYRVQSELGKGGFATVYLAIQLSLNRRVALKIMNPAYAADDDLCERFVREGQDLAIVSEHVSIVTVYDVGQSGKYYYIAMQYLPGPTLKQLIQSNRPYQHPLHIITRVAEALAYAHSKGYVHRDIKPANILFNAQGEAVLSDFGIAKTLNRDEQLTQMGQLVGTELYMSPEQALREEELDGRSDIYSLGVLFFETLTRELPYQATRSSSVLAQHINSPVPQLPDGESEYQPLIDRMMAKDPDDRYSSANEMVTSLQTLYFHGGGNSAKVADVKSTYPKWVLLALVIVCLLAIGSSIVVFMPSGNLVNAVVTVSEEDQQTLSEYMELAELNELLGRTHEPPGSNAVELYQLVLSIDPNHEAAQQALDRLESR